jgi:hypothetical protein
MKRSEKIKAIKSVLNGGRLISNTFCFAEQCKHDETIYNVNGKFYKEEALSSLPYQTIILEKRHSMKHNEQKRQA